MVENKMDVRTIASTRFMTARRDDDSFAPRVISVMTIARKVLANLDGAGRLPRYTESCAGT